MQSTKAFERILRASKDVPATRSIGMTGNPTHEAVDRSNDSRHHDDQLSFDLEEVSLTPFTSARTIKGRLLAEQALTELAIALGAHRAAVDLEVFRRSLRQDES
jgi:hypothetical protein